MSEEIASTQEPTTESQASAEASWRDALPEDLRGEASLADFKDINGLAKSYVNAQRMLGGSIRIPGEDASTEVREEFFKKLDSVDGVMRKPDTDNAEAMAQFYESIGRPAEASGYKMSDQVPESVEFDEQALAEFNQTAHNAGLTSSQYKVMLDVYAKEKASQAEMQVDLSKQFENQTREMWGNEFSKRTEAAKAVKDMYMQKYPDATKSLISGPNGSNPVLLSMLAELSGTLTEKGLVGAGTRHQFGTSAEEAREKIGEVMSNKSHLYWQGDVNAVERIRSLYSIAYEGGKAQQ